MPKIICTGAQNKGFGRDAITTGMQIGGKKMPRYTDIEIVLNELEHTPFYDERDKKTMEELLRSCPYADFVEAVRCKDCIHSVPYNKRWQLPKRDDVVWCCADEIDKPLNGFCEQGKRREDAG